MAVEGERALHNSAAERMRRKLMRANKKGMAICGLTDTMQPFAAISNFKLNFEISEG